MIYIQTASITDCTEQKCWSYGTLSKNNTF